MKITSIIAKESPYYGAKAKIHKHCADERVEIFLLEEEMIVEVPLSHLAMDSASIFKPRSRKEFYEYIQNPSNARRDLVTTLKYLFQSQILVPVSLQIEEELINLLEDANREREEIIHIFRSMRDEAKFEFKLANNSGFHPKHKKSPRHVAHQR